MTKYVLTALICALCIAGATIPSQAQTNRQVRKERMKALRQCKTKKGQLPVIRLNLKEELTVKDFLDYPEKLRISVRDTTIDSISASLGMLPIEPGLDVTTQHYLDSVAQDSRRLSIREYRRNELSCFFGREDPLILFGNQEISKKAFEELPEDTVAFVNFYLTDFVREYYAPKGKHGIVYVCPRKTRSKLMYTKGLPLPANGRNYIEHFYTEWGGLPTSGDWFSLSDYIKEKQKEYKDEIDNGTHATVITSCIVHTDGTVEPFFVEQMNIYKELTMEQKKKLARIAADIIRSMPPIKPGAGELYDRNSYRYVEDPREVYRSIPISFHKD